MSNHQVPDHRCARSTCEIDWILDPTGPDDPAWMARVRAEWDAAPNPQIGRPKSETHRAAIAASLVGNTRARAHAGRRLTAEHRAAISAGLRRRLEAASA